MPDNVDRLRANIAANGLGNDIHVIPSAIGGRTGTVDADITWQASVSARASADIAPTGATQSIEMLSLADALARVPRDISLMKLDCEGAEFEIVDQMTPEIATHISCLTFEVHDQDRSRNTRTLRRMLERLGYEVTAGDEMRGRDWLSHLFASR